MLDSRRLGTGERMPADESGVLVRGDDRALGRADVGHDAIVWCVLQSFGHEVRERADGYRDEHGLRAVDRFGDRRRGSPHGVARQRRVDRLF